MLKQLSWRSILMSMTAFMLGINSDAVPAMPGIRTISQPDGTTVELTLVGDEYMHYYIADDGAIVLPGDDGGYYFATINTSGAPIASKVLAANTKNRNIAQKNFVAGVNTDNIANAMQKRTKRMTRSKASLPQAGASSSGSKGVGLFPNSTFPTTGNVKGLIILVEYSDVSFRLGSNAHSYFDALANQTGFSQYNGTGCAAEFYRDASCGVFNPQFDVYGPVTLPNPMAYYGGNDATTEQDVAPEDMIVHAVQILDDTVDFSQYDTNHDGILDNVFVIYAGQGEASYGTKDTVWPHSWDLYSAGKLFMADGVYVNRYACTNEWQSSTPDGIGTFVHEFSHVMGLPDLYDTVYKYAKTCTPNSYSVMDHGSYNNNSRTPPTFSSFERNALGWANLETLQRGVGADCTLEHLLTPNKGYIIPTSSDNEFFLLENRQQTGWDMYLPGHGMLIWHIDYDPNIWNQNIPNNDPNHQYVDIEEAGGTANSTSTTTLAKYPFPGTLKVREFTDTTTPNMKTWAGTSLNTPITDIKETSGLITFKVCGGAVVEDPEPPAESGTVYKLVTDNSELTDGSKIIIAAKDYDYVLGTTQNSKNRSAAEITKTGDYIDIANVADAQTITIEQSGNYFNLNVGEGYLYASSNSYNALNTSSSANTNTQAEISISTNGTASIIFAGQYSRNVMQYNSSNNLFACYSSASQKALTIYKCVVGEPGEPSVTKPEPPTTNAGSEEEIVCNNTFTLTITPAAEGDEVHYSYLNVSDEFEEDVIYSQPIIVDEYTYFNIWSERGSEKSSIVNLTIDFATAEPTFSLPGGTYKDAINIELSSETEGATIYYTTDGTLPSPASSEVYTEAIALSEGTTTIKAMAVNKNWTESEIVESTYTIVAPEVPQDPEPSTTSLSATFDFTEESAYGMTLLTGNTTDYNPESVVCTENDITLTISGNTRWWATSSGNEMRFYKSSTFTIDAPENYDIVKVELVEANRNDWSTDIDTYSNLIWTGNSESVVFSCTKSSGNTSLKKVIVTLEAKPLSLDYIYNNLSEGDSYTVANALVVIYSCDEYIYVYDPIDGVYGLIIKDNLDLSKGDTIDCGWSGTVGAEDNSLHLIPNDSEIHLSNESYEMPDIKRYDSNSISELGLEKLHSPVHIAEVTVHETVSCKGTEFTGYISRSATNSPAMKAESEEPIEIKFVNRFDVTPEKEFIEKPLTYSYVQGIVGTNSQGDLLIYPTEFSSTTTGVETISIDFTDTNATYYNLMGVPVNGTPQKGIYLKVANGKATKVVVR